MGDLRRAPFAYYGGKGVLLSHILPLLPPHDVWCELFCGSAVVTLAKPPAPIEVINDLWEAIPNFYRVLRDPEQCAELQRLLDLTPYSRTEYSDCRHSWEACTDPVERARQWFVVARQSFSGRFGVGGWRYSFDSSHNHPDEWRGALDGLAAIHRRMQHVQIECHDWRTVLGSCDRPGCLVYADPPYIHDTRKRSQHGYRHEMTDDDHRELVARLRAFRGHVLLSGYDHAIYRPLDDDGWHRREVVTNAHSAGRTRATGIQGKGSATRMQARTEVFLMNYDPAAIHGQQHLFAQVVV